MKVGDLVRCTTIASDVGIVLKTSGPRSIDVQVLYFPNRKYWTPASMLEVIGESR